MRKINAQQYDALVKLADYVSAKAYIDETYGTKHGEKMVKHISDAIEKCDKLCVPFAVQINAIDYGKEWRIHKMVKLESFLLSKEVHITQ